MFELGVADAVKDALGGYTCIFIIRFAFTLTLALTFTFIIHGRIYVHIRMIAYAK